MKNKKNKTRIVSYELHLNKPFERNKVIFLRDIGEIAKYNFDFFESTIIAKPQVFKDIKKKELIFEEKMSKIFK